ncbi:MAG: MFS transporter [Kiritimatiellia bacterium]
MKNSYKWLLLALLSCAFFFHQADRALFGLLTERIQGELHLDDLAIGAIHASLFCTLAVMTPVAGFLGDRFSRKWIITGSLIFWSLTTALTGSPLVTGMYGLIFFRSIATGGGESFYAPSAYALLATHHRETRSVAMAVHQAALYVGLIFSGKIVKWVIGALDHNAAVRGIFGAAGTWRLVFIVFGALGFLLGVLFVFVLRDRPVSGDAAPPRPDGRTGEPPLPLMAGLKAYFRTPSALLASAGFIAVVFANNAYMSWAPKFAARKYGVADVVAGDDTMFWHYAFAFGAIMLGGVITDRFVGRHPRFRLALQSCALLVGAPVLVFLGRAPTYAAMLAAIVGYGVFRGLFEVNTHASLFDVVEPKFRSIAVGLMTMSAFFVGSLAPPLIGWLSKSASVAALAAKGLSAEQVEMLIANPRAAAAAPLLEQIQMSADQVLGLGVPGFEQGFMWMGAVYAIGGALMLVSAFCTFRRDRIAE